LAQSIVINQKIHKIHKLEPAIGGVKIKLKNRDGKVTNLIDEFQSSVIDLEKCKRWLPSVLLDKPK